MSDTDKRRAELAEIGSFIQKIDSEVTMILQSLQWDRKHLMKGLPMTLCRYDSNHRMPPGKLELHEAECRVKSQGYSKDEQLLPEAVNVNTDTLVTLGKADIINIIEYAAKIDPTFKKGRGPQESEPLSLERLQQTYSTDERRAIHDAVVSAVPSCHDLMELALLSDNGKQQAEKPKSRAEILAELRDMKRRRTKYRVAAKTSNYSDVLRDVISTQMELYAEAQAAANPKAVFSENIMKNKDVDRHKHEEIRIKKEPVEDRRNLSPIAHHRHDSKDRHRERERRYDEYDKRDKYRDTRERYSGSRSRDNKDSRSRDAYRKEDRSFYEKEDRYDSTHSRSRDSKEHRSKDTSKREDSRDSRYSSSRDYSKHRDKLKRDFDGYDGHRKSHREDKYKRYYDYEDDRDMTRKRIKEEKD